MCPLHYYILPIRKYSLGTLFNVSLCLCLRGRFCGLDRSEEKKKKNNRQQQSQSSFLDCGGCVLRVTKDEMEFL